MPKTILIVDIIIKTMALLSDEKIQVLINLFLGTNNKRPHYHYILLNECIQDGLVELKKKHGRNNEYELTLLGLSLASDLISFKNSHK